MVIKLRNFSIPGVNINSGGIEAAFEGIGLRIRKVDDGILVGAKGHGMRGSVVIGNDERREQLAKSGQGQQPVHLITQQQADALGRITVGGDGSITATGSETQQTEAFKQFAILMAELDNRSNQLNLGAKPNFDKPEEVSAYFERNKGMLAMASSRLPGGKITPAVLQQFGMGIRAGAPEAERQPVQAQFKSDAINATASNVNIGVFNAEAEKAKALAGIANADKTFGHLANLIDGDRSNDYKAVNYFMGGNVMQAGQYVNSGVSDPLVKLLSEKYVAFLKQDSDGGVGLSEKEAAELRKIAQPLIEKGIHGKDQDDKGFDPAKAQAADTALAAARARLKEVKEAQEGRS